MQCQVCKIDLKIADRQGIEIDYCPQCRGIWLNRGELDKIIERSVSHLNENEYKSYPKRTREFESQLNPKYFDFG